MKLKRILLSRRLAPGLLAIAASSCASAPESNPAPADEGSEIETLEFEIEIAAPVEKVWDVMFSPEGYTQWTAPFGAGSTFEGSWSEGERIRFLGPGETGMLAEIAANRTHEFVSIRHLGFVVGGVEDTTSDEVRSWAPAYENYRFTSVPGGTVVSVEQEVLAGYESFMQEIWPKALAALQSLCEAN